MIATATHFRCSRADRPDIAAPVPEQGWLEPCDADSPGAVPTTLDDMTAEEVKRVVPPLPTMEDFERQLDRPQATLDPRRPLSEEEGECWALIRGTVMKPNNGPRLRDIVGLEDAKKAVRQVGPHTPKGCVYVQDPGHCFVAHRYSTPGGRGSEAKNKFVYLNSTSKFRPLQ